MTPDNKTPNLYRDAILTGRGGGANHRDLKRRPPPAAHRFAIGQTVSYSPGPYQPPDGEGLYRVVRLLPAEGGGNQYRLESDFGGHERVAHESQLSLA